MKILKLFIIILIALIPRRALFASSALTVTLYSLLSSASMAAFRYLLSVLQIYSLHDVYYRFSVLAVNIGTQPISNNCSLDAAMFLLWLPHLTSRSSRSRKWRQNLWRYTNMKSLWKLTAAYIETELQCCQYLQWIRKRSRSKICHAVDENHRRPLKGDKRKKAGEKMEHIFSSKLRLEIMKRADKKELNVAYGWRTYHVSGMLIFPPFSLCNVDCILCVIIRSFSWYGRIS